MDTEAGLTSMDASDDETNELFRASMAASEHRLRELLEGGADPNLRTVDDESPLTSAIVWNRPENVRLLIEAGADCEQRDSQWSPLMYAAFEGHVSIAKVLLNAGADPNRRDGYGRTAADLATAANHQELAQMLRGVGR